MRDPNSNPSQHVPRASALSQLNWVGRELRDNVAPPATLTSQGLDRVINQVVPMVIEQTNRGERTYDIWSLLLKERIMFVGTPIFDQIANLIVAQLLFLAREDPERDISMYVNSPGGSVTAGMAMYDTMQLIQPDIATTCVGLAASMGSVLLMGGAKGKRYILPNARVMIHQGSAGFEGTASDIEIQAKEILRIQQRMREIYSFHTGKAVEDIARDLDRDFWMGPDEAIAYGLCDQVVGVAEGGSSAELGPMPGTDTNTPAVGGDPAPSAGGATR